MKKVSNAVIQEIKEGFCWGEVTDTIVFRDIIILEYADKHDHDTQYHPYLICDGIRDFNHSYADAETALVNAIAFKYDGINSQAGNYFMKMIGR